MKLFDTVVDFTKYVETLVLPKGDKEVVFKARPLRQADEEEFDLICPAPKPPVFFTPGSTTGTADVTDRVYLDALMKYRKHRTDFLVYRSLSATEGLAWDTVVHDDPNTWGNVTTELRAAGFLEHEVVMLFNLVIAANGLDSEKIRAATESFLATAGNKAS